MTSFILTEMEISAICRKVNLEVERIIHQHRKLLIAGALFLDSLEIKLSIQKTGIKKGKDELSWQSQFKNYFSPMKIRVLN